MMEDRTNCDLFGCQYNEDGVCNWENATIKMSCARACDSKTDPYNTEE